MAHESGRWDRPSIVNRDPLYLYAHDGCTTLDQPTLAEMGAQVTAAVEAGQNAAIEATLQADLIEGPGERFIASSSFLGFVDALGQVEQALAGEFGQQGLIHMTRRAATLAASLNLITVDGQRLRTILGTPVAAGGGYSGGNPDGYDAPAGLQTWIYGSGPVRVRLSPIEVTPATPAEAVRTSNNEVEVRASRFALIERDPCFVIAAPAWLYANAPETPEPEPSGSGSGSGE